jgi:outer membrane lipoprotein-sorting protein
VSVPRRRSSAALGAVLAVLAGCVTLPPAPREPIAADAREVIARLEARAREFVSLRTLAEVVVQQRGERHQLRGVLLAKAPTSVRFEALSPMGSPLLVATVHEGRVTAYDATTNEGFVGPATADVTARLLHLPFEAEDLVRILSGHPTPPPEVRAAAVLVADDVGPSIELRGKDNRRRIWFDPDTIVVRQFELTGGRAEARVRYLRNPRGEVTGFDLDASLGLAGATVRYQNPSFAVALGPDAFTFTIPKGAKIQDIR